MDKSCQQMKAQSKTILGKIIQDLWQTMNGFARNRFAFFLSVGRFHPLEIF